MNGFPFPRPDLRRIALLLALLLAGFATRAAAVTVSPSALFIDSRSRTGTLTLYNGGTLPEEVEVSFAFGYPVSDSAGTINVELRDTASAGEPSIVPWLRAFPRRLVLQPGQRQVLRVLVQPPADLAEGEYWGRVLVRARGGQPPIEQTNGDVRVQLNVETVIATALMFRKGAVETGIAVQDARAEATPEGVQLTVDVARQGTAAYLGRIRAQLVAPDGRVQGEVEDAVAVYRTLRRRFVFPAPAGGLRPGYTVRYTFDTERPDLPSAGPVRAAPVAGAVTVR
jgi:P pilus assembly chaperone PapD